MCLVCSMNKGVTLEMTLKSHGEGILHETVNGREVLLENCEL